MNEVRIKLPLKLHQQWSDAADLRGLSLTSFIISTISGVLISTGELDVGARHPVNPTPKPTPSRVASKNPFDDLPDPRKFAESLNIPIPDFVDDDQPLPPGAQAVYDDWADD